MRLAVKSMNFVLDILCLKCIQSFIHPFTEYPICARSPVRGGNVMGQLQAFDNDLYMAGSDQHVKCCRIVNRKCYGWHLVGIVGVELRVRIYLHPGSQENQ